MMTQTIISMTEADDMLITPYLKESALPSVLTACMANATTDEEKDMALVAGLTAVSAVLPNVHFRYGRARKTYYPNLQTFIMAGPASGKGIAQDALDMVRHIDEQQPIVIPGDSTYPAFFRALSEQGGIGYLHESEGSVITDIWRSSAMNYNTALRKAAEHETLSRNRMNAPTEYIYEPRMSMLLTGTFDQFQKLVPSVHNGFFSRLTLLVVRRHAHFNKHIFQAARMAQGCRPDEAGRELTKLWEKLQKHPPMVFQLTEAQEEQLGEFFYQEYGSLIEQLGENFHPSVIRMGVTTMRIACILTALRLSEQDEWPEQLICRDEDFDTALLIAAKLLLHAADAFEQIQGGAKPSVPEAKRGLQRNLLLAALPQEFSHAEMREIAQRTGTSNRSADRWISDWTDEGKIRRIGHGQYLKIA